MKVSQRGDGKIFSGKPYRMSDRRNEGVKVIALRVEVQMLGWEFAAFFF